MTESEASAAPQPRERILLAIHVVRGHRVMLDADLAALYGVETKAFNQAVKRNIARFPSDFMFRLTAEEAAASRSQLVTLNSASEAPDENKVQRAIPRGANVKYLPYAFTEQGVSMLSSVLRSPRAVQVNIEIMRTFVQLRQALAGHEELSRKLDALEARHDRQFGAVFDAIRQLVGLDRRSRRRRGFFLAAQPHG